MTRSIKSWIISSIVFSLLGALIGALLASQSMQKLSRGADAISQFERLWSEAVETDIRASHMAKLATLDPTAGRLSGFRRLNAQRMERFLEAVAAVPRNTSGDDVSKIYDEVRTKGEIEQGALAFAATGRLASAQAMLVGPHYLKIVEDTDRDLQRLRTHLSGALDHEQEQAGRFLIAGLLVLFICVLLAGSCWWRVGRLFRDQAIELAQAHQELGAHTVQLEARIVQRTSDLEAAKLAAEAADRAKSAFLAQMSHEIRTPLNGVLGMADALSHTKLNERQARMLDVVRESGSTLLALLNDVLDLAKIESGKLELEAIAFQADELVRSAEAVFTSRAHEKGISFAVRATGDVDGWCIGDPTRLRQVLYNLVSNAVKFTETGGVSITLDVAPEVDGNRTLRFDVCDSGIGMDDAARARLFQRFSQADASTTRKFGGSGLGLAICQQLLITMGGTISVESAPEQGSVFSVTVCLPSTSAPDTSLTGQLDRATEPARQLSLVTDKPSPAALDPVESADLIADSQEAACEEASIRILAADDNAHNRLVLQLMLEQLGLEAVFAQDGAEAVELWKSQAFDLVLMDIQMPVLSGHDATRAIRALEAEAGRARTPIIALTANAMTHHVQECMDAGMDAHVAKPIRPELLFAAMDQALSAHDADSSDASSSDAGANAGGDLVEDGFGYEAQALRA